MRRAALAAALIASALVAGCSDDDARPPLDDDVVVLSPASDGAVPHTHTRVIGTGTTSSAGGYRIVDVRLPRRPGPGAMSFRIVDRQGRPLRDYTEEQTKKLHLYVVRTDYQDYRHLHAEQDAGGTWRTRVDLADPGRYRVIAEFVPGTRTDGAEVVLGSEVTVAGAWRRAAVPDNTSDDDGVVELSIPRTLPAGADRQFDLTVSDGDGGVLNLGSYLGAYAHLTGFELSTGRFVHAHPLGAPTPSDAGDDLTFHTTLPLPGRYRFFVQVRVDGFLHTLAVTARAVAA